MANLALAALCSAARGRQGEGSDDNGKNLDSRTARVLEKFIRRAGAYKSNKGPGPVPHEPIKNARQSKTDRCQ
jgi:hypothetical protein